MRANYSTMRVVQEDVNEMRRTLRDQIKVMRDIAKKLPEVEGRTSLQSI